MMMTMAYNDNDLIKARLWTLRCLVQGQRWSQGGGVISGHDPQRPIREATYLLLPKRGGRGIKYKK